MNRGLTLRVGAAVIAGGGVITLAATRPMSPAPMLICFALLLGVVLLAAAWPGIDDVAVDAAQMQPDRTARATTAKHAFDSGSGRTAAAPAPPPAPASLERQWERACAHHDSVLGAYGAYELDPAMLLTYPAMWDLSAPAIMDFHDALELAGTLRTAEFTDDAMSRDYVDAVSILRSAWHTADRHARSTGTDHLSDDDARDCRRALKLLDHANGTAGAERATYLQQVVSTVDRLTERGVVAVAPKIHAALEVQVRHALEA